ncbi:hypothetical protein THIOKS1500018 [Thiocapsa sp. KS1]|nr:hypothetical protein THIOKS1500018 [Thiocapsa sp. KS1]
MQSVFQSLIKTLNVVLRRVMRGA